MFQIENLMFFGVNLVPFIIGLVFLLRQETKIPDYVLDWVGALLMAAASVFAFTELQNLMVGELTWGALEARERAELLTKMVTTFLGVLLVVKGYWPTVRDRTLPKQEYREGEVASFASGEQKNIVPAIRRFSGKY